ncbi:NPCBM/NEW2 domain-containing protein [Paludisphaera soli]|uniref:NPCBM/NEW2 domain-containing protein n=1 Tax=Paludisphaera soli TaxID=2712865 RepID=UPI0013EA1350|nr:NPCBM/NEW2 domain-containing protein [Paludisphaera soli]
MSRPRRRAGFRPGLEQMERRAMLSGAGVNLSVNKAYAKEAYWNDVQKTMSGWGLADRAKYRQANPTVPTTADGYALAPASAQVELDHYPDGAYQVSFKGTAKLDFWGVGQLAAPMVTGSDGVTRGTIIVGADKDPAATRTLIMTVLSADPSDPWSDLRIWAPGSPADGSQLYTSDFLQSLEPFDYIRFLDWTGTNNSLDSQWSQRTGPEDFFKGHGSSEVSYEEAVELSNESGNDMWLTIPALADDDYVANLAALVRDRLAPHLKIYVEYSNETWNTIFKAYSQVLAKANADPRVLPGTDMNKVAQESGLQTVRIGQIFREVFGADAGRVLPVFSGWAISPSFLDAGLKAIDRVYGAPAQFLASTAIAPYTYPTSSVNQPNVSSSAVLAAMEQRLPVVEATIFNSVRVAAAYGLPLDAYEGGQHLSYSSNYDAKHEALNDPRMYDLYRNYYALWERAGGRQMTFYTLNGEFWGLKNQVNAPGSQRWDAVMSLLLQPGDADLDGVVDFDDFRIVQANFDRTELWWQQGDFNHDRNVDAADLSALLARLDLGSLTASQAAEIAVALRPATSAATAAVPFQVYGQANVGDATFASTTINGGSLTRNGVFNGGYGTGVMQLGGVSHATGLGVSSRSTVVVPLDRRYTSFAAIIGVDDRAGLNRGQATFQVVGDGRVLYTSPVMKAGVGLPIDVDVTGVSSLSLIVTTPAGASVTIPADWAQARLVDARSEGRAAPTLTWTVTKGGSTISSTTAESFVFVPTGAGEYQVSVRAVDASGDSAVRTAALTVGAPARQAGASFFGSDPLTSGSWKGAYGSSGAVIVDDYGTYPEGGEVQVVGALRYVWNRAVTADKRALQKTRPDSKSYRVASAWYGSQFTIDVEVAAGTTRQVSLYAMDWDNNGRVQKIEVLDAATNEVLDTRQISSFGNGVYLTWDVSGKVRFRVTKIAGYNAVIGGVFFDEFNPIYEGRDSVTKGNWRGPYGSEGYLMLNNPANLPAFARVTVAGAIPHNWTTNTTDVRALRTADGTKRQASVWSSSSSLDIDVSLTDGKSHVVSLYALDWDTTSRIQRIDVIDRDSGEVLDSRRISAFNGGLYLSWTVSGNVRFRVTRIAGNNAVISGVFIDPAAATEIPPPSEEPGTDPPPPTGGDRDDATKGSWIGAYGADGHLMLNNPSGLPSYAQVGISGASQYTWASSTGDVRALRTADGTRRQASAWYASGRFTVDLALTDGRAHKVSLYMLDWDTSQRSQRIELIDPATGEVLDVQEVSSFNGGAYLSWTVSGRVQFRFTRLSGHNAVLNGLFIDPAETAEAPSAPPSTPQGERDNATKGSWIGVYGGGGQQMLNNPSGLPSYAQVGIKRALQYTWASSTGDVRALRTADGTRRQASAWYAYDSFTVDLALTDGRSHKVSLYMLDWDTSQRSQRIELIDPATGEVLDVQEVSSFNGGAYLSWTVSGRVQFRFTRLSGHNAVLNGLFID